MTVPEHSPAGTADSRMIRVAIWTAIGALIAAAVVCVVWVLVGTQSDVIGRAFLTILLLAAFAGVALLETRLAPRRPAWFALTSMITWVVTLLLGAVMIWMPFAYDEGYRVGFSYGRFIAFLLIVLVLQLALLHVRLYIRAHLRHVTPFTRAVAAITVALVAILAVLLVLPLAFGEYIDFSDTYGRWVVSVAILAAVGTALVPLINALFAPKKPRPEPAPYGHAAPQYPPSWPTYADGVTPLPVMFDGSPDWTAYYTGYPSTVSQAIAPVALAPVAPPGVEPFGWAPPEDQDAAPWESPEEVDAEPSAPATTGYEGYPPPPPLPPRP